MSSDSYLQWLNSPTTAGLASNASLHYIPTTTTITESTAILKHLTAQAKQIEKKEEKILNTINGDRAAAIETSTTFQFNMGGGAYLPNIDSNLLDERTVVLPLTHIVNFDGDGKITQIRLYWDQATLLKQAEAIGKSGRNWPIRDGKAQADLITSSVKASGTAAPASSTSGSQGPSRNPQEMAIREGHSKRDSVSVTRDPHASLALFNERDPNADRSYTGPAHSTRASAKPAARGFGDMVAGEADAGREEVRPRSGHSKNFSEIRLFNENDEPAEPSSPERKKTYTQKYDHFAFGNGEDAPQARSEFDANRSKSHSRALNFEDYATPEKLPAKGRPADERHWGAGVDTVSRKPTATPRFNPFTSHFPQDDPSTSPPKRPIVHAARPDQQSHFEFSDVSPLPAQGQQKQKSLQRQKGMGLYHDPVMDDERVKLEPSKTQSATQTNVDASRRAKDYSAQYSMADDSPVPANGSTRTTATTKSKARQDQESQWSFADTPEPASRKIYKTAGDGMGSRAGGRAWGIGDESDPEIDNEKPAPRRSARGRRREDEPSDELEF